MKVAPLHLRLILIILLSTIANNLSAQAILRNIEVSVQQQLGRGKPEPYPRAYVWGFFEKRKAEEFLREVDRIMVVDSTETQYQAHADSYSRTGNDGRCILQGLPLNGYIVCYTATGDTKMEAVKSDGTCVILFTKTESSDGNEYKKGAVHQIDSTIQVKGKAKKIIWKKPNPIQIGWDIFWGPDTFPISEDLARSNGRYGMSIKFVGMVTPDTLCYWRPFIKDGTEFHTTQNRRKGFNIVANDSLGRYVEEERMKDHEESYVVYWGKFTIPEGRRNQKYRGLADLWAEDYNGAFFKDTLEVIDGYPKDPLRFLHFKIDSVPINASRYPMTAKAEEQSGGLVLHFDFEVNQTELMESQNNELLLQKMLSVFGRLVHDPSFYPTGVTLQGKASPEGSADRNLKLAKGRAGTIEELLKFRTGYSGPISSSGTIATYEEIIDTLEALGETSRALMIKDIITHYKSFDQQHQHVKANRDLYDFLLAEIYPKLRTVNLNFSYIIKRPLEQEEIIKKYEEDTSYRDAYKEGYEYYYLFPYLRNRPAELEKQARMAYERIYEVADIPRPWPLAAYYYAQCLNSRNAPNKNILAPYIKREYPIDHWRLDKGGHELYWNDEAIIVTEIGAYCGLGEYGKARFVAMNYLKPEDSKYNQLRLFLECYDPENLSKPEIIDAVAATSSYNKAVIYAAQDEIRDPSVLPLVKKAAEILRDSSLTNQNDARVRYLAAEVGYRLRKKETTPYLAGRHFTPKARLDVDAKREEYRRLHPDWPEQTIDLNIEEDIEEFEKANKDQTLYWGYDMIRACQIDSSLVNTLKTDGYFDNKFRKAFNFFWIGLKDGWDLYDLAKEWDALPVEKK